MTSAIEQRIGYRFRDPGLLAVALTHPSVVQRENYQRMEFLGDAVLGLVVSRLLYGLYPADKEGELARRRSALVRRDALAEIARTIGLGEALALGSSEVQSGGRDNPSNLEDAMEALIGAIYLDGGMEAAERFVLPLWQERAQASQGTLKDAKTQLQEWAQGRGLPLPDYRMVGSDGPAHAPSFTIEAGVEGYPPAQAQATSKRAAEQAAAQALLDRLENGA